MDLLCIPRIKQFFVSKPSSQRSTYQLLILSFDYQELGYKIGGRVRDRIKVVLLASEGWSSAMISQALRIHETTVVRHINDYLQSEKLKPENGGSQSRMSTAQTMQIIEHLAANTYFHTHQIVAHVEAEFGIHYSVAGMNKWLHHNGFSYKKPKGVPHKFCTEKQQAFVEYYNKVLKPSEAPVLFMDAVHPTQSTKLSYGWIRKG